MVTTGAISRAKLQSNHHHQQTNIQFFYRPDAEMPTWDNDNKEGQASKKGRKREEIQAPKIGRNDYFCNSIISFFAP